MAKLLPFIWCLLDTKPYYGVDLDSHHRILEELARLVDEGKIKCHLTRRLKLTLEGLREARGKSMGEIALGAEGDGRPFG